MANTLKFKRGLVATIPTAALGEPLFTTDTFDLYIGNGTTNTRFQKYIASGTTSQILRGDGSLYTFPLAISSPSAGQVLKYNGTSWVNDSDAGITGSGTTNYLPKFTGATTLGNSQFFDNGSQAAINQTTLFTKFSIADSLSATSVGSNYNAGILNIQNTNTTNGNLSLIGFQDASAFINLAAIGAINEVHSGSPNNVKGSLGFYTKATGGGYLTERMRLHSTGNLVLGGTVSTDNGARLQVSGTSTFSDAATFSNTVTAIGFPSFIASSGGNPAYDLISTQTIYSAGRNWRISSNYNAWGTLEFLVSTVRGGTPDQSKMTLDASGRLLLGSGSVTSELLQVNGTMRVSGASTIVGTSASPLLYLNNTTGATATDFTITENAGLIINSYEGASGRSIDLRVGGTSALLIASTGAATFSSSVTATVVTAPNLNVSLNNGIYDAGINTLGFQTSSLLRMQITSGGNVLVGTTTDAGYKLDVNGTMRVSGASTFNAGMTLTTGVQSIFTLASTDTNGRTWTLNTAGTTYYGSGAGSFVLRNNGVDALVFNASSAATFSSSVTAGALVAASNQANTSDYNYLVFNNLASGYGDWNFYKSGANNLSIGYGTDAGATYTNAVTFAYGGAATFSSSVTCASLVVDSTTLVVDATNNRVGVGTNVPTSSLHVVGSVTKSHTTKTANYTMTESDYTVLCDTTSGGFTISLPAASGCSGRIYVIKKITGNSGTNNITIDPNGSETIDGATTHTLQCRSSVMIQSNGSNWWILAEKVDTSCL